jgi:hypothetical protein
MALPIALDLRARRSLPNLASGPTRNAVRTTRAGLPKQAAIFQIQGEQSSQLPGRYFARIAIMKVLNRHIGRMTGRWRTLVRYLSVFQFALPERPGFLMFDR